MGTIAIAACTLGQCLNAQVVNGVAYDSLRGRPFEHAFVMIAGDSRVATTDAFGRFRFDSVGPGTYTILVQHPALDSAGLGELSARANVTDGRDTIRVSSRSLKSAWRAVCGSLEARGDSGILFGVIRNAAGSAPVRGAAVSVSWLDVSFSKDSGVMQHRFGGRVESDSTGGYFVCGVPANVGLRIRAATDSAATGWLDLPPRDLPIQRRDLVVGPTGMSGGNHGVVAGTVSWATGKSIAGARVLIDAVPEARTDDDGRFILPRVPLGTQQIQLLAIGAAPSEAVVDVHAVDTTRVDLTATPVTALDPVHVTASEIARSRVVNIRDRRKLGLGEFIDSTKIAVHVDLASALSQLFPSRPRCSPLVWVDGIRIASEDVSSEIRLLPPAEVALVEWYHSKLTTPPEFNPNGCGSLVVWTKWALRR